MTKKRNHPYIAERADKWYLGGGTRLVWAPPFPIWLDVPGFWDSAHYYNLEIGPVFTWTLLDEEGSEIVLRAGPGSWTPSLLRKRFTPFSAGRRIAGLSVAEEKSCLPNDVLVSKIIVRNTGTRGRKLRLIAWTAQPSFPTSKESSIGDVRVDGSTIHFLKHIQFPNRPQTDVHCRLSLAENDVSHEIVLSEGREPQPRWNLTPFAETFAGRLRNVTHCGGVSPDGIVYCALQTTIELKAKSSAATYVSFAAGESAPGTAAQIQLVSSGDNPLRFSTQQWNDHFASVPSFECSDPWLTNYYWYRWFGMKLNTIGPGSRHYRYPTVCEGIGYFRAPISYSAPCHMLENRWRHTPELAQGSLQTFLDHQRPDGGFRGYIDPHYLRQEMFYHAGWGRALRELFAVHADPDFMLSIYNGMQEYARYFDRQRDPEGSGLYTIDNHYETGQEYMHRYLAVKPGADGENWGEVFRLKGVDVTIYLYELKQMLAWIAEHLLHDHEAAAGWREGANNIRLSVIGKMWDRRGQMFFDLDPATGKRTGVKAAICFYPYMTDMVTAGHLPGLKRHLFNTKEFWTPYPVPSSSADDLYFSASPEWKEKRMNCPWNGRVWPMTNSHIAEALGNSAVRFNDRFLRAKSAEFIYKYIRMMFFDGDPARPNCFEHYNPMTGYPSLYRGIDDYQHSSVVDLIVKYVAGLRPALDRIVIDPFPFGLRSFALEEAIVRGHRFTIRGNRTHYRIWSDGKLVGNFPIGKPFILAAG